MQHQVTPASSRRGVKFPGITQAAKDLKISRIHLYFVLDGRRDSPRTLRRWNQWLSEHPEFAELQPN